MPRERRRPNPGQISLGEGSGACLALGVLEASARVLGEMATFDAAAVKDARH